MTIKEKREELNISQAELARMCEISPQLLCDIENGRCKPSIVTAIKLAKALKVKDINFFDVK